MQQALSHRTLILLKGSLPPLRHLRPTPLTQHCARDLFSTWEDTEE